MLLVEAMHAAEQGRSDRFTHHRRDLQASGLHRLAFALDIAALVGIEYRQIVIKIFISTIEPGVTLMLPAKISQIEHFTMPLGIGKQEAAAGQLVAPAQPINFRHHGRR